MTDINKDYPPLAAIPFKARQKTDLIVVHCADTPPSMDVTAKMVHQWHVRDNGWACIGYHFVIRRDGTIEGGRPVGAIGAHAALVNSRSVGICMAGGKGKPGTIDDHFTKEQQLSLVFLLKRLLELYPQAEVVGHRNVDNQGKTCPSFDAKNWWLNVGVE